MEGRQVLDKFFSASRAQYIARPDGASGDLVYLHPDTTIPRGAKLTVRSDESAVFFREGRAVGVLKAGAYVLDTQNVPFLGGLINLATGGNHYIAEVFFVRTAETPIVLMPCELGTFIDVNSRNLLKLVLSATVTVSVTDGLALVTQLGGQSADSGAMVTSIVGGRLRNALKSYVATQALSTPIAQITSNAGSEAFGNAVVEKIAAEFKALGLRFVRFVDLHIDFDEASLELLREYQKRESDLVIDSKGAQVAADPGFTTYNAVKGGRSVADGLGAGLSKGMSAPVVGMGFGFGLGAGVPGAGSALPGGGSQHRPMPADPRDSGARRPDRFLIEGSNGTEGPFTARQAALWILSSGRTADSVRIRQPLDPEDLWSLASAEPAIMAELNRRSTGGISGGSAFDAAFAQACRDNVIVADEMALLVSLARSAKLASTDADARQLVERRAAQSGVKVEPISGASAGAPTVFAYWNGTTQEADLSRDAVADRVRAAPAARHYVWTPELGNWTDVRQVPDFMKLFASPAPPPPPM
jgi:membrane protease subunit (stomatin/prohibitin family)